MAKETFVRNTFREQHINLQADESEVVDFFDTDPNNILVSSSSPAQIFVARSSLVGQDTFDLIVPAYGTRLYTRQEGVKRIYVYCSTDAQVSVESWEGEFNPAAIAQTQEIASPSSGALGTVDVNHILNPLPAGTNKIGVVDIAKLPAVDIVTMPAMDINSLPAVAVQSLPSLPAGANTIGNVGVNGRDVQILPGHQAEPIVDTVAHEAEVDCSAIGGKKTVTIVNTLDQDVNVSLMAVDGAGNRFNIGNAVTVAAGDNDIIGTVDNAYLADPLAGLVLSAICAAAPTAGTLTTSVEGVPA